MTRRTVLTQETLPQVFQRDVNLRQFYLLTNWIKLLPNKQGHVSIDFFTIFRMVTSFLVRNGLFFRNLMANMHLVDRNDGS